MPGLSRIRVASEDSIHIASVETSSYAMSSTFENEGVIILATAVKPCPFCGGKATIRQAANLALFWMSCSSCSMGLTVPAKTVQAALKTWTLRRGTVSALGGRATRGKCSKSKRRSCRRNLQKARLALAAKRERTKALAAWEKIKVFRRIEWETVHLDSAKSWAELEALEPQIRKYPDLAEMFDWLKERRAANAKAGVHEMPESYRDIPPETLAQFKDWIAGKLKVVPEINSCAGSGPRHS